MGYYELYFNSIVHDDMDNGEYELYHHGVKGQKWGVRRDKYLARIAKNNDRIAKREKYLSTVGAKKRDEMAAHWQLKADKIDRKRVTRRAKARLAVGKTLNRRQQAALVRSQRAHAKVARYSEANDKQRAKIAVLERKNARYQKKVDRLNKKIAKEQLKSPETQKKVEAGKRAVSENPNVKAAMNKTL